MTLCLFVWTKKVDFEFLTGAVRYRVTLFKDLYVFICMFYTLNNNNCSHINFSGLIKKSGRYFQTDGLTETGSRKKF